MGWMFPNGAPQAMQLGSPGGLGVLQKSQMYLFSLSDNSKPEPSDLAVRSITLQTLSTSCTYSISCAISSRRFSKLSGLRKAEIVETPRLAATPHQACLLRETETPSVTFCRRTLRAVEPPDLAYGDVASWMTRLSSLPNCCTWRLPRLKWAIIALARSMLVNFP